MVRSIRHWGVAAGVLEEDREQPPRLRPADLGRLRAGPVPQKPGDAVDASSLVDWLQGVEAARDWLGHYCA